MGFEFLTAMTEEDIKYEKIKNPSLLTLTIKIIPQQQLHVTRRWLQGH